VFASAKSHPGWDHQHRRVGAVGWEDGQRP
jgi:hypothetical protein